MSNNGHLRMVIISLVALSSCMASAARPGPTPDQRFQSALAHFHAGQLDPAAGELEALLPQVPGSFEVHELLGLVYAAQSRNAKAVEQLQTAVDLKPDSVPARTNLAAALIHAGKPALAGDQFRKALALKPQDFETNHNLGEFYIQAGQTDQAMPLLELAHRINPSSFSSSYDLALAYSLSGNLDKAEELTQSLLREKNAGELHTLLGQILEKEGKFVAAANEFETAAQIDPSEENLFDWGSELLLHRTYDPAITVFEQGTVRYPQSPRLFIGLGMAYSARGKYDDAIHALLKGADLDPADSHCYRFLFHAYDLSASPSQDVVNRFKRYAELQPKNAGALFYYAMSLKKGSRPPSGSPEFQHVEALLKRSITLDDSVADVHLQLGNLYADQHDYDNAFPQYVRALKLNPNLTDAHYRLGQYYVHAGRKDLAQREFDTYQQQRAKLLSERDREGNDVQQFIYSARSAPAPEAVK